MILVIMAAGIGSRFGGIKQLTSIGPNEEFLIDYSVYDAIRSGITKVIFIIKKENEKLFKETIGKRIEKHITVEYIPQEMNNIPNGINIPQERIKPLGTAHALYCLKDKVKENFIIINADYFYGYESIKKITNALKQTGKFKKEYYMAGFKLDNTLNGKEKVSRGICNLNDEDYLINVEEHLEIMKTKEGIQDKNLEIIDSNATVSVNLWAFTPTIFENIDKYFKEFAKENENSMLTAEFYLPTLVSKKIKEENAKIKVIKTESKFYGMTYQEDIIMMKNNINALVEKGEYPKKLWD